VFSLEKDLHLYILFRSLSDFNISNRLPDNLLTGTTGFLFDRIFKFVYCVLGKMEVLTAELKKTVVGW
jgi:hypothetical protein